MTLTKKSGMVGGSGKSMVTSIPGVPPKAIGALAPQSKTIPGTTAFDSPNVARHLLLALPVGTKARIQLLPIAGSRCALVKLRETVFSLALSSVQTLDCTDALLTSARAARTAANAKFVLLVIANVLSAFLKVNSEGP